MKLAAFHAEPVARRPHTTLRQRARLAARLLIALVAAPSLLMADTILPPTLTMEFSSAPLSPGGITVLTITIANPNPGTTLTGVGGFSVDLSPLKMTTFTGAGASGCVGTNGPQLAQAGTTDRKPRNNLPRPQRGQRQASPVDRTDNYCPS